MHRNVAQRATRAVLVSLCVLAGSARVEAAPPAWDELPPRDRDVWHRLIGLEAGIAMMHCVQPLSAAAGEIEWTPKHAVATAGCALYGGNTVALVYRQKFALWVNVVGPVAGLTTVATGWALHEAGAIDAEIRPDIPQLVGGVLQVWAWFESLNLLLRYHRRGESLLRHARVRPTPRGLVLTVHW